MKDLWGDVPVSGFLSLSLTHTQLVFLWPAVSERHTHTHRTGMYKCRNEEMYMLVCGEAEEGSV